jgi:hypothetical protein
VAELEDVSGDDYAAAEPEVLTSAAGQVVQAAPAGEQATVAQAAVDALDTDARAKFITSLIPQDSKDRLKVYKWGFLVALILGIGLALIAWGAANTNNKTIASAIAVGVVSIPSAIIAGLLGAYVQR